MITSASISLRALEPEDLDLLYRWENNAEWWIEGNALAPYSKYDLKRYIDSTGDIYADRQLRLMIELPDLHETIGTVDVFDFDPFHSHAGIGILIDKKYQSMGYGHLAIEQLQKYLFEFLNIHLLYAHVRVQNEKSVRLFKNCGFEQSGVLKEWVRIGDSWFDCLILTKSKSQYLK